MVRFDKNKYILNLKQKKLCGYCKKGEGEVCSGCGGPSKLKFLEKKFGKYRAKIYYDAQFNECGNMYACPFCTNIDLPVCLLTP